jgi:signal transduction histidine kinase
MPRWRGTVTRLRADRSTFPVAVTVAALRGERGDATHFVWVERDISEERRLREQLIHSERLSAIGQLVAGVAHELNNPLQGVMGHIELRRNRWAKAPASDSRSASASPKRTADRWRSCRQSAVRGSR